MVDFFLALLPPTGCFGGCSLKEPPLMKGCWEPNLKLREAQRLFEDQISGPESIANIGGQSQSVVQFSFSLG